MTQHKLAFVGPEIIHTGFKSLDSSWDMQSPMPTLEHLEADLAPDNENPKISRETNVIIFFSRLYNENPKKFAEFAAFYAPYAVVAILIPTSDIDRFQNEIENEIRTTQIQFSQQDPNYNSNTPFYFVKYENAQADLFSAINSYCNSPFVDDATKEAISAMLPNNELSRLEEDDEFEILNDDDEIIIPEASPNAKGKVIAVTSSKGGSGKSTISMSIANYISLGSEAAEVSGFADRKLKTIVIDLDTRDGQLGFINGAHSPNIVNIMTSPHNSDSGLSYEAIKDGIWHNQTTGVDYIFASKRPRNAKEIPASMYAEIIQILREEYDYIILDTSVNYLDPLLEEVAYPIADKIVFVTDMGISSIFGMLRWINENIYSNSTDFKIDENKVGIVINKAIQDVNMAPEKIQKAAKGLPIIGVVPSAPKLITYSANTLSIQRILSSDGINSSIKDITESLIEDEHTLDNVVVN